jgi:DNA-binding FrmR family transcriptional regulator
VLRLIASARGAMDSLMAEVIEGHIRDHAFRGARARSEEDRRLKTWWTSFGRT